jgi:hypothetical protein
MPKSPSVLKELNTVTILRREDALTILIAWEAEIQSTFKVCIWHCIRKNKKVRERKHLSQHYFSTELCNSTLCVSVTGIMHLLLDHTKNKNYASPRPIPRCPTPEAKAQYEKHQGMMTSKYTVQKLWDRFWRHRCKLLLAVKCSGRGLSLLHAKLVPPGGSRQPQTSFHKSVVWRSDAIPQVGPDALLRQWQFCLYAGCPKKKIIFPQFFLLDG